MSLENKNLDIKNNTLETQEGQIQTQEKAPISPEEMLTEVREKSTVATAEFSDQIEKDKTVIIRDTEHGSKALDKLTALAQETKVAEGEFKKEIEDIILFHGGGFSGITLENLSIKRTGNKDIEEKVKWGHSATNKDNIGFYAAKNKEIAIKYAAPVTWQEKIAHEEIEKSAEYKKLCDTQGEADQIQTLMLVDKMSYKEAVDYVEKDNNMPVESILKEKEYTVEELVAISKKYDPDRYEREEYAKRGLEGTLYKLTIDKNAKVGELYDVLGPNKIIERLSEEDLLKARDLGYDILTDYDEYVLLNKDVIKEIDKSTQRETVIDEKTGKEKSNFIFPELKKD